MSTFVTILAAFAVVAMGFAIQRGGTCLVAAVEEVLERRRATRLVALVEASLWVTAGFVVLQVLGLIDATPVMPHGYAVTRWTVVGALLLGLGAAFNGACVFGTIARLGNGEWVFALTPVGYLIGAAVAAHVDVGRVRPMPLAATSPVLEAATWLLPLLVAGAAWRVLSLVREARVSRRVGRSLAPGLWSPHKATTVIGISFFVSMLLAGAWAYTDGLAEVARGRPMQGALKLGLLLALVAGACVGGVASGRFISRRPSGVQALRCLGGGAAMALGSLFIPGSNDGLLLIGMPLLWPYAWVALATMAGTIGLALSGAARLRGRTPASQTRAPLEVP